jgi:hypothetical protein
MVSPNLISTLPMLPDPVSYLESELLSSLPHFLDLVLDFLIAFSSLSNFLLNAKDCLAGLDFILLFLAVQESAFYVPSFPYLQQSLILCVVCTPPCFLQRSQCFSVKAFLGTLIVASLPGCLVPFSPLLEAFLPDCVLDFSCAHTRSIASRDIRANACLWKSCFSCGG